MSVRAVRATVVTANIGRGVRPSVVRENVARVRHGFPGAFIGWCEIDEADEADEHAILERQFGPDHYRNVAFRQAVPISVPNEWEVLEADVVKACDFIPHATPNRYIVSALCKHPNLAQPVVFENGHYNLPRLGGREGRERWQDCHANWTKRTLLWHREGHTVITTRDTNRLRLMPKLHPTERQLLPNAIVRISVVEGSVAVRRVGLKVVNMTIDGHDAKGVDLVLSVKEGDSA